MPPKGSSKKRLNRNDSSSSDELTQRQELPGVDHKNRLGPQSHKFKKGLDLNTNEGEARFLGAVKKEISKKSNVHKLQTAFQSLSGGGGGTDIASKIVVCTNQDIALNVASPLDGITWAHYINKNKNPELVRDIPQATVSDDEDDDGGRRSGEDDAAKLAARPSVIAVNLKWKHGITFRTVHKYSTKTVQLEPLMKKTDFDYENKTKFDSKVESVCDDVFPEWKRNLMILDGNECHRGHYATSDQTSRGSKLARSERLQKEETVPPPLANDPYTREWKEYSDLEEHKVLVIPYHSKAGFDMDLSTRYEMPYQAKFVIGRKAYHHKFMLRLPMSKSPQHYGLIFTFSEDPLGHVKFRVKSLLTVYCIHPTTTKYATLETYDLDPSSDYEEKKTTGPSKKAAKNAVDIITDNLKEENLARGFGKQLQMSKQLPQAGDDCYRNSKLHRVDYNPDQQKQKKKNQIRNKIKMEQARC